MTVSARQPVPLLKQSKKARRAYYQTRRNDWNGVVPVTRVIPDKRKRAPRAPFRDEEGE